MMPFIDAAARFVLAVLFNGLWEAAILAAAAWLVLRFLRQGNATTRHSVLAVALFASLILPIATTIIATMTTRTQPSVTVNIASKNDVVSSTRMHQRVLPAHRQVAKTPPIAPVASQGLRQFHLVVPRLNLTLPRAVALAIVALWLAGAGFVLLRLFRSLFYLEGLKRESLPVPIEYRSQLVRWSAATKGSREVRLCRSSEVVIPIAVGLFDAMILVPERLLEELAPNEIDQIVLHELAHLRRADDWINAVERIAQALLFFNPGIAWLVAQLDLEREVACDDWVLQQNDAVPYASCLAKVVETTMWPCPAMSAPGAFVTRRDMSVRIERLLARHRDVRVRTSFGPIGLAVTAFATLCIAIAFVSPSIAYTTSPEPAASPIRAVKTEKLKPASSTRVAAVAVHPATVPKPAATVVPTPVAATAKPALPAAARPKVPAHPEPASKVHTVARASAEVTAASTVASSVASAVGAAGSAVQVAANSPAYADELASVGYSHLTVDELVEMRAVGVTADYIRQLAAAGITHPSVKDLVQMKAIGVTPAFVGGMRARFGNSASLNDIAGMRAVGVTPGYLDELGAAGVKNLTAEQAEGLRAVGVTGAYAASLARAGYPNLTATQLTELRALGIDGAFVQRAAAHGMTNLTVDQLVRLKASGVL
jgi:beta-lactamase regulating signal transducer with metallopeptidase domain